MKNNPGFRNLCSDISFNDVVLVILLPLEANDRVKKLKCY